MRNDLVQVRLPLSKVVVNVNRRDAGLFGTVTTSLVPVSAMRGISIPLLVLLTSSIEPIVGRDPSLLIATFWAVAGKFKSKYTRLVSNKSFFIS